MVSDISYTKCIVALDKIGSVLDSVSKEKRLMAKIGSGTRWTLTDWDSINEIEIYVKPVQNKKGIWISAENFLKSHEDFVVTIPYGLSPVFDE